MVRHISELARKSSVHVTEISKILLMSSLKKLGNFLGLTDDLESEELDRNSDNSNQSSRIKLRDSRGLAAVSDNVIASTPISNQIFTVNPRSYNEARAIGERYREGHTVLMNLTDMGEPEMKRLVDFASGLVFGHHGTIEKVTNKVFLLSPANVKVSNEVKTAAAEASFFNQS